MSFHTATRAYSMCEDLKAARVHMTLRSLKCLLARYGIDPEFVVNFDQVRALNYKKHINKLHCCVGAFIVGFERQE